MSPALSKYLAVGGYGLECVCVSTKYKEFALFHGHSHGPYENMCIWCNAKYRLFRTNHGEKDSRDDSE